jgi:hypothetical protein
LVGVRHDDRQLGGQLGASSGDLVARLVGAAAPGDHDRPVRLMRPRHARRAAEGEIDLVAFHEHEHRRYILAFIVLALIAILFNIVFGGANYYSEWLRDTLISAPALAAALLAFFIRARWAQVAAAVVFAALATYFLIVASNVTMT